MDKTEFNNLIIEKQVEFINKKLQQGLSITQICKEMGIANSTVRTRFNKEKYIFDKVKKQYISICVTDVTHIGYKSEHTSVIDVLQNEEEKISSENTKELQSVTQVCSVGNTKEDYIYNTLVTHEQEILQMLRWYKKNIKSVDVENIEVGKTINRSFRLGENVLRNWNEFCEERIKVTKETKKELLEKALIEYIKYKKM